MRERLRGLYFRDGVCHDLVAAELHAHHYTCRRMMQMHYRRALRFYLEGMDVMLDHTSEYARIGAERFRDSRERAAYVAEANRMIA